MHLPLHGCRFQLGSLEEQDHRRYPPQEALHTSTTFSGSTSHLFFPKLSLAPGVLDILVNPCIDVGNAGAFSARGFDWHSFALLRYLVEELMIWTESLTFTLPYDSPFCNVSLLFIALWPSQFQLWLLWQEGKREREDSASDSDSSSSGTSCFHRLEASPFHLLFLMPCSTQRFLTVSLASSLKVPSPGFISIQLVRGSAFQIRLLSSST